MAVHAIPRTAFMNAAKHVLNPSDAQLEALIARDHLEQVGGNR
jgi:hypothetical protein